jgi:4-amino-4-deoxy-L-arabinose transferase-like glycosyltransferase
MNRNRVEWLSALAAFGIRLAVAVVMGGLLRPELWEYDEIARAMIAGRGFTYPYHNIVYYSYAPPLYSWLSAASYWLTGSLAPVMLLQITAGAALAAVAAWLARKLFDSEVAAGAAGLLAAVHPGLVLYSATKAHPMTFDALFFALAVLQFFRLRERPDSRRWIELGFIIGVGTLSRTTIIIFLPIGAAWLLYVSPRSQWWPILRGLAIASVITVASLTPWTIRNYRVHHQFVFVLTTDGDAFWRGNNPNATGHSYTTSNQIVLLDGLSLAERQDLERQPNELAQSAWFMNRARAFIREHPGEFVRLTLRKWIDFWWFVPQTGVRYPAPWFWLYAFYYVVALALAGLGVWKLTALGSEALQGALLLAVLLLALSALQSLYYVEGRHRWGVETLLLAFSGGGVAAVVERWRDAA